MTRTQLRLEAAKTAAPTLPTATTPKIEKGRAKNKTAMLREEYMDVQAIIDDIDRQFVQMRRVRELFVSIMEGDAPAAKRPGRPKGPSNRATGKGATATKKTPKPAKRTMSAEGKARIAAAQKKRWAAQKQAQEPATRKDAAKPKAARKTAAKAKKTTAPDAQPASETTTADAEPDVPKIT